MGSDAYPFFRIRGASTIGEGRPFEDKPRKDAIYSTLCHVFKEGHKLLTTFIR